MEQTKSNNVVKPVDAKPTTNEKATPQKSRDNKFAGNRNSNFKRKPRKGGFQRPKSKYEEKVINISRVTKVVKGGRRFSFSVTTVIGNRNGKVGFGHGKANEIPDAIKKSIKIAERNMIDVPIVKGTVPHEATGKFLSSKILLKPAPKGKGIIASSSVRVVVELAGYKDIYTKSFGSRSKQNVVQATIKVLKSLRTLEKVAKLRDLSEKEVLGRL